MKRWSSTKKSDTAERLPSAPLTLSSRPNSRLTRASIATVTLPETAKDFSASAMVSVPLACLPAKSTISSV
jgi:hypothetical protein